MSTPWRSSRTFGSHQGRGGRGRVRGNQHPRGNSTTQASPAPPIGDLIEEISKPNISGSESEAYYGISAAKFVASYNWMDHPTPKIMVPGKPPLWTPLQGPQQLRQDDGTYYRDRNAAAYNAHPMEAALVSVMRMLPQPGDHGVDVFTCGSTLGNLRRFIQGDEKPFRMLLELVGTTVCFIRRENSPNEQMTDVRGYGHSFPEAYTVWEKDVKRSTSHQRVLSYRFDGLNMMVRFEGDGYVKPEQEAPYKTSASKAVTEQHEISFLDDLMALGVQNSSTTSASEGLGVVDGGEVVAQDTIFDLKTRSIRQKDRDTLGEELPRLWVAQIRKFILAHHTSGCFENVEVQDIWDKVQTWEADHQPELQRLAKLLHYIVDARLKESEDVKWELARHEAADTIEIRKRLPDAGVPFSDKVRREWVEWVDGNGHVSERGQDQASNENEARSKEFAVDGSDDESEDFTACDEECGYCGRCHN